MLIRVVVSSLIVACLYCPLSLASAPAGLAANLVTDLGDTSGLPSPIPPNRCEVVSSFEWIEDLGEHEFDPADTLTLEMAILPFRTGQTFVGLDTTASETFFGIQFSDGSVDGLPYRRAEWNDVVVEVRLATEDYVITVNGMQGGPFSFDDICLEPGGCFSARVLRIHGLGNDVGSQAWMDSIAITRNSATGSETIYERTFDPCPTRPFVVGGAILITTPPERFVPRGRSGER